MPHPRFPLPEGHMFSPGVNSKCHDGGEGHDGLWLAQAQQALRLRWRFDHVHPTGHLDAATQAALVHVQTLLGADRTGWLDEPTWDAVFTLDPRSGNLNKT